MKNVYLKIAIVLFTVMFIVSGTYKTITLGDSESSRFSKKVGTSQEISKIIVFCAGLFELVASAFIIYGIFTDNDFIAELGVYGLIIFTVLATLIFYVIPFKYQPFLSNLSVIMGLYLILNLCMFKE